MQGVFILAIIFALFTAVAAVIWRVSISRRNSSLTKAQEAEAAVQAEDTPSAGRGRSSYRDPYESLGRSGRSAASRAEQHRDAAESADMFRFGAKCATIGLAAVTALGIFASSFWIVGTQNVGIVRSFGRPVGVVANGPAWTWPWEQVTEMDYSVQVTDFTAASCDIQVRLADGQTACPKVGVRWQINTRAADSLFRRYKGSTQGVENGVLIPALQTAANTIFGDYDPVKLLSSPDPVGSKKNPSIPQLASKVQALLVQTIGSEVQIDLLNIPNIAYSPNVQNRINAVLGQKAQTLIAQQAKQTADAQAAANQAIAASVSHDPGVLISRCEDLMQEMIKNNQSPTIGMCNFGGSGNGVIVSTGR
jgi:regulator of protease activity HflC (stomatin/prohibitin superfamily)